MFNHLHYVPVLKSKRAEFSALYELSDAAKAIITPLIDVIPVPWDYGTDSPKRSLKAHIDCITGYIVKSWPRDLPMFLDLLYAAANNEVIQDKHAALYCFESLRRYRQRIIPVTRLDRDDDYQNVMKSIINKDKMGACLRIQQDDLDDFDALDEALNDLTAHFEIPPTSCDILLDFQALPLQEVRDPVTYISNVIRTFPNLTEWRTFTVAASNFPKILEMTPDSDELISRDDYNLWRSVVSNDISRLPSFGDYSIQHPEMSDIDYRKIKISVNLRYATEAHWLVYKGREKNRHGHQQFNRICKDLVNRPEFGGSRFSAGDNYISGCAINTAGPGTPEIWRKVGFNHHITLVAKQIANFGEI